MVKILVYFFQNVLTSRVLLNMNCVQNMLFIYKIKKEQSFHVIFLFTLCSFWRKKVISISDLFLVNVVMVAMVAEEVAVGLLIVTEDSLDPDLIAVLGHQCEEEEGKLL